MDLKGLFPFKHSKQQKPPSKTDREIDRFRIARQAKAIVIPENSSSDLDIKYPLIPPFAYAGIKWDSKEKILVYKVIAPSLSREERTIFQGLKTALTKMLDIEYDYSRDDASFIEYIRKKTKEIIMRDEISLSDGQITKILYYIYTDFVGLNRIEPLMRDAYLEDIGCDGVGIPLYVTHKRYGSLKTNIVFNDPQELKEFVIKLAERGNKYISYAEPLLDSSLPDGSRVQATLAEDVTTNGPTFSIRKFTDVPYSPVDIIKLKTTSSETMAYLWFILEHQANIIVCGGTGTGKTTFLNALLAFVPPESKIVSIEDTRELNLVHQNWIPSVARRSFGTLSKTGERYGSVSMFDLLKESFRQNPDYVVVGEVRGEEANVLFQGMASGHPSLGTMHAGSVEEIIERLESRPINLSPSLVEVLDVVVLVAKTPRYGKSARRVRNISEIESIEPSTGKARTVRSYSWQPGSDGFEKGNSYIIEKISTQFGIPLSNIEKEISDRKTLLDWLLKNEKTDFREVTRYISMYYKDKDEILKLCGDTEESSTSVQKPEMSELEKRISLSAGNEAAGTIDNVIPKED